MVGESFSEIFFGNSVAIGLACLTAAHDDMERLQAAVERDPSTVITVESGRADRVGWWGHGNGNAASCRARVLPRRDVGRHGTAARSVRGGRRGRRTAAVYQRVAVRGS